MTCIGESKLYSLRVKNFHSWASPKPIIWMFECIWSWLRVRGDFRLPYRYCASNLSVEGSDTHFFAYRAELRLPVSIIRVGAGLMIWEVNCVAFEFEHFQKAFKCWQKSCKKKCLVAVSLYRQLKFLPGKSVKDLDQPWIAIHQIHSVALQEPAKQHSDVKVWWWICCCTVHGSCCFTWKLYQT